MPQLFLWEIPKMQCTTPKERKDKESIKDQSRNYRFKKTVQSINTSKKSPASLILKSKGQTQTQSDNKENIPTKKKVIFLKHDNAS